MDIQRRTWCFGGRITHSNSHHTLNCRDSRWKNLPRNIAIVQQQQVKFLIKRTGESMYVIIIQNLIRQEHTGMR